MRFPAVLIDFPNSKVCLKREWSIDLSVFLTSDIYKPCRARMLSAEKKLLVPVSSSDSPPSAGVSY